MRFVYKCCISLTKLAFHLQTVHLNLQTCVSLTIVAPRFTNATFRFTIKPPIKCSDCIIAHYNHLRNRLVCISRLLVYKLCTKPPVFTSGLLLFWLVNKLVHRARKSHSTQRESNSGGIRRQNCSRWCRSAHSRPFEQCAHMVG